MISVNKMPGSEKLISGLRELNLFSEKLAFTMDKYIGEIILFNSAYNLTNTSGYDEIAVKHVLDSLSAASIIEKIAENLQSELKSLGNSKIRIADIGSGGGFPGIPLAAALPDFDFVLVERMDKRCAFLENEAAILGLKNVSVMKTEAEKIPPESFDLVTFRAFRPLDKKMAMTLLSITKKNGIIAAFKAKKANIQEEMEKIREIVREYKIFPLRVPFLTESGEPDARERNLVVFGH